MVRLGIKAHNDPRLTTDLSDLTLPIDAPTAHEYAVERDQVGVRFFVDGRLVTSSRQSLDHPVQLMVEPFAFPLTESSRSGDYPKTAVVHRVRGHGSAPPRG